MTQFRRAAPRPRCRSRKKIGWSQNAKAHLALLGQPAAPPSSAEKSSTPVPQKAPAAISHDLEFAAASIKLLVPGSPIPGYAHGIACRGTDGMQRVIVGVRTMAGEIPGLHAAEVDAPRGRCAGNGIFLSALIELAYGIRPRFVSGFPEWARQTGPSPSLFENGAIRFPGSGTFQIEAVADDPATATVEQLRQMVQTMLVTRFKLQIHLEKRESRGYSLVIAKNGPKAQGDFRRAG